MNLRPRDKDKEIGAPSFRFGAKTNLERVYDEIVFRNCGVVDSKSLIDGKMLRKLKNMTVNNPEH